MGTPLGMSFGAVGTSNIVPPEVQVEHLKALQITAEPVPVETATEPVKRKRQRARSVAGQFKADDQTTPENEAWLTEEPVVAAEPLPETPEG